MVIPIPFILISLFVKKATSRTDSPSGFFGVAAFFTMYLLYIAFASFNGWFEKATLPPKVLLLTTFPYAFLLFGIVIRTQTYKAILKAALLPDLVKLHIFRLIGVFFILLAFHDALPKPFALIAGLGDIITAVSSIFVAKALETKKSYALNLAHAWNIFGAVDILFTAIFANVLTKISLETGAMGVDTLATFPFCIIPAFAPPTILFMHWSIFRKLKKNAG